MSQNFRQPGRTLTVTVTEPAGVKSGQIVERNFLIGVAAISGALGEQVEVDIEGVFELPKNPPDNILQGQILYLSGQQVTIIPGAGAKPVAGMAARDAAAGSTTVECKLGTFGLTGPA